MVSEGWLDIVHQRGIPLFSLSSSWKAYWTEITFSALLLNFN